LFHELLVRRPLYHALEKQLRRTIRDNETRFRIAGDLLFYTEQSPRRTPDEHARFRVELEAMLGKVDSDGLVSLARTLFRAYRFTLMALKGLWLILFLAGTWGLGRVFVGWGWNAWASLLAAAFVVGAILELGKWLLAWRIER
jgi:hypothetical protein